MAYDTNKLTKLAALKALAERTKSELDKTNSALNTLSSRVDGLVSTGGEPNIIETVKVNGVALQVGEDKDVDITVPTKVSDLTNDSNFQTDAQVSTAIQSAISSTGHASFEVATSVPDAETAQENILYLVKNDTTGYYDIYALVSGEIVRLDDTTVNLTDYVTTTELESAIQNFIKLSDLSVTTSGSGDITTSVSYESSTGVFTVTKDLSIATDIEVTEMLNEVFGASA